MENKERELGLLKNIELVSFDIWQTLLLSNPAYKLARAEALQKYLGAETMEIGGFAEVMKNVDDEIDEISDSTGVQYGLKERVRKIYERLPIGSKLPEISDDQIDEFEPIADQLVVDNLPSIIEDDLLSTLEAIRQRGIKMAVVSNTGFISGKQMRMVLDRLGILPYVTIQVFSNEVGHSKPNKLIFETLASISGVDKSKILHVGDNFKADCLGAITAGLKSVQLTNKQDTDSVKIEKLRDLLK